MGTANFDLLWLIMTKMPEDLNKSLIERLQWG